MFNERYIAIMKKIVLFFFMFGVISSISAQVSVKLNAPDMKRGSIMMEAFAKRQSTKSFANKELSKQDLADLLWAANGVNRSETGKRTAPSAMNRQDVTVYVCLKDGVYQYKHKTHTLDLISKEDVRQDKGAPVCLVLTSNLDGTYGAIDTGIVSQNISLFCSGAGLATYPRGTMNKDQLKKTLKLNDKEALLLCQPVGYAK